MENFGPKKNEEKMSALEVGVESAQQEQPFNENEVLIAQKKQEEEKEIRTLRDQAEIGDLLAQIQAEYARGLGDENSISERRNTGASDAILAERARISELSKSTIPEEESSISPGHNSHAAQEIIQERNNF